MRSNSNLVIYFSPHLYWDPSPIPDVNFQSRYSQCDTFILDYGERWYVTDATKEDQYNQLSQGTISPPIGDKELEPFTLELQKLIHNTRKRIILERSPVDIPSITGTLELLKYDLDRAVVIYLDEMKTFADSLVARDVEMIDNIVLPELQNAQNILIFRGLAHEAHFKHLLEMHSVEATYLNFPTRVNRNNKILSTLTLRGDVSQLEVLQAFHEALFSKEAPNLTEEQARKELISFFARNAA